MGQGAYLSTVLAIRIVVREVGQAVVAVVVAAEVVVVGTRVVVLGRVASAAVSVVAPPAALWLANSHGVLDETTTRLQGLPSTGNQRPCEKNTIHVHA